MDYRILGQLEVREEDRVVPLRGDKQRALLAILLLAPNEVVSADQLVDFLWGESPPPTALKPREVRFVRNPHFHEWSRAARPDGYPDQIVARFGTSPSTELTEVERGSADYTLDGPPPGRVNELETRFPSQLHINPDVVLDEIVLNTHTPPFTDIRVRRALNYAVDRRTVAGLAGSEAQPSCQFLTPYIPGYKRYCPYTLHPSSSGAWRAPDMAKARRLISASRTRGTPITIWNLGLSGNATAIGRYVVSLLDRLGYRARLRDLTSDPRAAGRFADSRTQAQLALIGYFPNYPAASEYINWFLSCRTSSRTRRATPTGPSSAIPISSR